MVTIELAAIGGAQAGDVLEILHAEGKAVEGGQGVAAHRCGIGGFRRGGDDAARLNDGQRAGGDRPPPANEKSGGAAVAAGLTV